MYVCVPRFTPCTELSNRPGVTRRQGALLCKRSPYKLPLPMLCLAQKVRARAQAAAAAAAAIAAHTTL